MKYLQLVNLYKSMGDYIKQDHPDSSVLTVFPFNQALREPYLGYIDHPLNVVSFHRKMKENPCELVLFSNLSQKEDMLHFVEKDEMVLIKRLEEGDAYAELYGRRNGS
jgi:hypothetical protein